jgi:DNA-binding beta-propeller fold protein YncE
MGRTIELPRALASTALAVALGAGVAVGSGACGYGSEDSAGSYFDPDDYLDTGGQGRDDAGSDTGGGGADLPPEEEERSALQAPRASRSFVFVANTEQNTLARIDSVSLQVTPIEVCIAPTLVRTLPTLDRAVTLCRGDDQVAVVDAGGGEDAVRFGWVAEGANAMILSPGGDYVLAWYDERDVEAGEDAGNPQDLTLVALGERGEEPASYLLSVGFGVRDVQLDAAGEHAYVTTEDGLNVIELAAITGDQFVPLIPLGDDRLDPAADREVAVSDDGRWAFVRTSDFAGLRVIDLRDGERHEIALPAVPTDLDLLPGGATGLAAMREISTVALLPLPEAVDDPEAVRLIEVPGAAVGLAQVTPDGASALLYSTVGSEYVTRLDLDDESFATYRLRKPVAGLVLSPGGERAVVRHGRDPGEPVPGEPVEDFIAKSFGYSLFDVASGFSRLVLSPAEPGEVVFSEDGGEAWVLLADAARSVRAVQRLDVESFRADTLEMARLPEQIGIVPATGRIYVSQLADTGRITFIDTETGQQRHVTAYELSRRIE